MNFTGGYPETRCGGGSTVLSTNDMRTQLPALFETLGTKVLLDAPCGDFNWMRFVELGDIKYVGVDFDPRHISDALKHVEGRSGFTFLARNIVKETVPKCDTVFSRDFFQHLPSAQIVEAMKNFIAAEAKWLVATSFTNLVNANIRDAGGFRPVNLQIAPFNLGAPDHLLPDPAGSMRFLGVWPMAKVKAMVG